MVIEYEQYGVTKPWLNFKLKTNILRLRALLIFVTSITSKQASSPHHQIVFRFASDSVKLKNICKY